MQPELTSKQQALRDYLEREIARTGKAPSLRQAAANMGVSHAAVSQLQARNAQVPQRQRSAEHGERAVSSP